MKIIQIISTWSKKAESRRVQASGSAMSAVPRGHKRVMAIVAFGNGEPVTRHIVVPA